MLQPSKQCLITTLTSIDAKHLNHLEIMYYKSKLDGIESLFSDFNFLLLTDIEAAEWVASHS